MKLQYEFRRLFICGFVILGLCLSIIPKSLGYADVKHPVFKTKGSISIKRVKTIMSIPDKTLIKWNPPIADIYAGGCPNCTSGEGRFAKHFDWKPNKPDQITCKHCGHVFPSKDYPLEHVTKVIAPTGEEQVYRYYEEKEGFRSYLEASLLNRRRTWMVSQAKYLGQVYNSTKDPAYAKKAGVILKRFAENYPHMPVRGYDPSYTLRGNPYFYKDKKIIPTPADGVIPVPKPFGMEARLHYESPYPPRGARGGVRQAYHSEIPDALILAYDNIAEALDTPTRDLVEDYFRQIVNYCRTFPRYVYNLGPYLARREIIAGRVIGEPEFVHGGIIRLKLLIECLYPDGMWKEGSPGYSQILYNGILNAFKEVEGYSDPLDFEGHEDGVNYQNFNFSEFAKIEQLNEALLKLRLPTGNLSTVYDTWSPVTRPRVYYDPLEESRSHLLWATGHTVLGRGKGTNQIQARLQFMSKVPHYHEDNLTWGHYHFDLLSLQLYAKGREMESDIGYTWTRLRPYTVSMLAHNTVMVDETSQNIDLTDNAGKALSYATQSPTVQFISVETPQAYAQCELYARSLALVKVSEQESYLVDLFEITGGNQHDWLLHGDADFDGSLTTDLQLKPRSGSLLPSNQKFVPWIIESADEGEGAYRALKNSLGLVRNIRSARSDKIWNATFKTMPDDGTGLRITMLAQKNTEIMHGEIPSVRRAKENNSKNLDFWMPLIIARRKGKKLKSTFLAVHEPYSDAPFITEIFKDDDALIVKTADFTDVHLFNSYGKKYKLKGRYGFLRIRNDKVISACMADGILLKYKDFELKNADVEEGWIQKAEGKRLTLSGKVSEDHVNRIILSFPTNIVYNLEIAKVIEQEKGCIVELTDDPKFTLSENGREGKFSAYPNTKFEGRVGYLPSNFAFFEKK